MAENPSVPQLILPEYFSDRIAHEMTLRGYYSADVKLGDGSIITLTFYDPVRLQQEINDEFERGYLLFSEPNLIIVPEVSLEIIRQAIKSLWESGFFVQIKPK